MSAASERAVLLVGGIFLEQETFLDDLRDYRLFAGEVAIGVSRSYSEPSRQKQHGKPPQPDFNST
jgi:hypothetical protein